MLRTFCTSDVPYHGLPLEIFEHALCWNESVDTERIKPGSANLPRALAVLREPASDIEVCVLTRLRNCAETINLRLVY